MDRNVISIKSLLIKLQDQGIQNKNLLSTIEKIPRENFLDKTIEGQKYHNNLCSSDFFQTFFQLYMVARMTELLSITKTDHILEIGTGSGYQTAILASLALKVFSVEKMKDLQKDVKSRLENLNLHNFEMLHGDSLNELGSKGPFDGIIVTNSLYRIPFKFLKQLKDRGKMVFPIGKKKQILKMIQRKGRYFYSKIIEKVQFIRSNTTRFKK